MDKVLYRYHQYIHNISTCDANDDAAAAAGAVVAAAAVVNKRKVALPRAQALLPGLSLLLVSLILCVCVCVCKCIRRWEKVLNMKGNENQP